MNAFLPFVLAGLAVTAEGGEGVRAGPLPFEFVLAPAQERRFLDPGHEGLSAGSVSLTVTLPGRPRPWRLDLFEDGAPASPRWRWLTAARSREAHIALALRPGVRVLAVATFDAPGTYLLSGPFRWPESAESLALGERPQRTVWGKVTEAAGASPQVIGAGAPADRLCEGLAGRRWQCVAVPADLEGVAVACSAGPVAFYGAIEPGGSLEVTLRSASWSALVETRAPGGLAPEREAAVTVLRPGAAGGRYLEAESEVDVRNLGGGLRWIAGFRPVNEQVVQFRGPGSVSNRLLLRELVSSAPCGEGQSVELAPAALVRGVVSDTERTPLPDAHVLLMAETGGGSDGAGLPVRILATTDTDAGGLYEFLDLAAGAYRVRACHPARGCAEKSGASGGEAVDVVITPHGVLRGRILSPAGVPEPDAAVRILATLEQYASAQDRSSFVPQQSLTGADGRFQIASPRNGRFAVEARAAGSGTARRSVEITDFSPPATDLGDLRLSDAIEFVGLVPGCAGGSLSLAGPVLGESPMPSLLRFEVGPGGRARIRLPDGGTWLVGANCAGEAYAVDPLVLPDASLLVGTEVAFRASPQAGR